MSEPPLIRVDVFDIDVALFKSDKDRRKALRALGLKVEKWNPAALAHAHRDPAPDGTARYTIVLKPETTDATVVHECCHMADFILDALGIPPGVESTETRAYLTGYMFHRAVELATWRKEAD